MDAFVAQLLIGFGGLLIAAVWLRYDIEKLSKSDDQ